VDNTNTLVWQHTVSNGPARMLVVGVSIRDGSKPVSNVEFAGVPLTFRVARNHSSDDNRVEIWTLANPPVTTGNIVVDIGSGVRVAAGAASFTGVSGIAGTQTNSGTNSSPSMGGLLGGPSTLIVDVVAANGDALSATESGSDQTQRWGNPPLRTGTSDGDIVAGGSTQPGALLLPSTSWSLGTSQPWSLASITLDRQGVGCGLL
jgi:hypothetical protein